ncbi:uncharacterized protein LOC118470501 isoform X3 [Amphiprion ocellaris]|uniref:uncharacterized protein LOC118470501 isoform X3 n=1 Tax=Amphiprion ocellaris TaxID=80972 RepID=UPI002410DB54|nr:uncharacterized protein LOC118470501 isoform X3 [Amphiprion ocellaris]
MTGRNLSFFLVLKGLEPEMRDLRKVCGLNLWRVNAVTEKHPICRPVSGHTGQQVRGDTRRLVPRGAKVTDRVRKRLHPSGVAAGRGGGGGGSGGGKREAEWVEEWKERRIEAVRGGGSKRVNPEQVNAAVDRHGLSGCLPLVAPVLHTGVPGSQQGPAKAAAEWAG